MAGKKVVIFIIAIVIICIILVWIWLQDVIIKYDLDTAMYSANIIINNITETILHE